MISSDSHDSDGRNDRRAFAIMTFGMMLILCFFGALWIANVGFFYYGIPAGLSVFVIVWAAASPHWLWICGREVCGKKNALLISGTALAISLFVITAATAIFILWFPLEIAILLSCVAATASWVLVIYIASKRYVHRHAKTEQDSMRNRIRCPHCSYSMATIGAPKCPECGLVSTMSDLMCVGMIRPPLETRSPAHRSVGAVNEG